MKVCSTLLIHMFLLTNMLAQEKITWSDHIGCLVYSHCTPCHHDNGIAPFSLTSYEQAYEYRYAMEAAVSGRIMPPWPPGLQSTELAGDRSLTDQEIAVFRQWVAEGAPLGDAISAPEAPVINNNEEITDPDLEIRLPDFTVPDLKEYDLYRCFVVMTNEGEDKYITGVEILPGNRNIVHHVILYQDTSSIPEQKDDSDPYPGYTCFGGVGSNSAQMIAGWVPGTSASFTPKGMGIFFAKGARLIAQIHYPEGNTGLVDSTRINIRFSDEKDLRKIEVLPVLNHFSSMDRPLFIPANTRQTFHQKFFPVPFDVTLVGIAPHAHLICESMKAFATTLRGDTIPLIDIAHWDFEWQGFYSFKKPVKIPAWSTVHGVATYNNTTSNHHLPSDVPVDVSVGEATTDEMMLFFFSLTGYRQGDENIVIDTFSHKVHHSDCEIKSQTTASIERTSPIPVVVGPNPAMDRIIVRVEVQTVTSPTKLVLFDQLGKPLWETRLTSGSNTLHLPHYLPSGIYHYSVTSNNKAIYKAGKLSIIH